MMNQPTPKQIAATHFSIHRRDNPSMGGPTSADIRRAEAFLSHLQHEDYVILHPDNVPVLGYYLPEVKMIFNSPTVGWERRFTPVIDRNFIFGPHHGT